MQSDIMQSGIMQSGIMQNGIMQSGIMLDCHLVYCCGAECRQTKCSHADCIILNDVILDGVTILNDVIVSVVTLNDIILSAFILNVSVPHPQLNIFLCSSIIGMFNLKTKTFLLPFFLLSFRFLEQKLKSLTSNKIRPQSPSRFSCRDHYEFEPTLGKSIAGLYYKTFCSNIFAIS